MEKKRLKRGVNPEKTLNLRRNTAIIAVNFAISNQKSY